METPAGNYRRLHCDDVFYNKSPKSVIGVVRSDVLTANFTKTGKLMVEGNAPTAIMGRGVA